VLDTGTEYKFKTAPVDPNDPFRGKYITLDFEGNIFEVDNKNDWMSGEEIFVYLAEDSDGYAQINSVTKEPLSVNQDFIKAKVIYVARDSSNRLTIGYPFNRFYLEESKAKDTEHVYRQSQIDTTSVTYALVSIKNGKAVLKDVLINEKSIREIVKENQR
jgi:uncharacterized membrane-anchored protein